MAVPKVPMPVIEAFSGLLLPCFCGCELRLFFMCVYPLGCKCVGVIICRKSREFRFPDGFFF